MDYYGEQLALLARQQSLLRDQLQQSTEPIKPSAPSVPRYYQVSDALPAIMKILADAPETVISSRSPYSVMERSGPSSSEAMEGDEEPVGLVEEFGEPIATLSKVEHETWPLLPPLVCHPQAPLIDAQETKQAEQVSLPSTAVEQMPHAQIQAESFTTPITIPMVEAPRAAQQSQEVPQTPPSQLMPEAERIWPTLSPSSLIMAMPLETKANLALLLQKAWQAYGNRQQQDFYLLLAPLAKLAGEQDAGSVAGEEIRLDNPSQLLAWADRFPLLGGLTQLPASSLPTILIRPQEDLKWALCNLFQGLGSPSPAGCLVLVPSLLGEELCADLLRQSPLPVALLK